MRVAITGASGLIGAALSSHLGNLGHDVCPVVRRAPGDNEIGWGPTADSLEPGALEGIDAVVHLAGAGIGDRRWTPAYKETIRSSRVGPTQHLAETIAGSTNGPRIFLSGSAIGVYGSGTEPVDESHPAGSGFLADVCVEWEQAATPAVDAGCRVAFLRTGIVLSTAGGALRKQLPLFRFGLGGRMGDGRQWQSWISIDDEVGAITHLLNGDISGPVNLTAPQPVTNAEFTTELGRAVRRPTILPIPKFGPRALLGAELAENLLFSGQHVLPTVLHDSGYDFHHPTLRDALSHLLGRG